jgi:hypothetical protein
MALGFDPNCEVCQGDGYLDLYTGHLEQSVMPPRCPACNAEPVDIKPAWPDTDADGWLDGITRKRARFTGGALDPAKVDTIVMHRYHRGFWSAGPKYFANPTARDPKTGKVVPRYVSAHFSVHKPGWLYLVTQHAPLSVKCWHAPPYNGRSIGIEHDAGPKGLDEPWWDKTVETSVLLVEAILQRLPNIKQLVAHSHISPKTRRDPGKSFPWERYEHFGLDIIK